MFDKKSFASFVRGERGRAALASLYGPAAEAAAARWLALGDEFFARPDAGPARLIVSPGRTELGGNHTDHNRGRVLCAAVHMDIVALAEERPDGRAVLVSRGWQRPFEAELGRVDAPEGELKRYGEPRPAETGRTESLLRGVAAGVRARGGKAGGFYALADSTVPAGSGLSSSAAFELLAGQIQNALYNDGSIAAPELAIVGQEAENRHFGKPCGLMDQMASALGAVSAIDFGDPAVPIWERVEFDLEAAGYRLAIAHAGDSHADLTDDYAAIPGEMRAAAAVLGRPYLRGAEEAEILAAAGRIRAAAGDRALLRALHFVAEDRRAAAMAAALKAGDLSAYLGLVRESGDSSWRLLQNVIPLGASERQAVACAVELSSRFLGAEGAARVHGGGFAGTIQAYVPAERAEAYAAFMEGVLGPGSVHFVYIRPRGAAEVRDV